MARIVRRDLHRRDALEAVDQFVASIAVQRLRADPVALFIGGAQIEPGELALATPVDQFGMPPVGNDRARLAARTGAETLPVAGRQAGHDHGSVVLLRAVDPVGILVVHRHLVDLGGGLVGLRAPGASAVQRNVGAAVVGLNHELRVARVDPDIVMIAMRRGRGAKALAAVHALVPALVADEEKIGVVRIDPEGGVVERPRNQVGTIR